MSTQQLQSFDVVAIIAASLTLITTSAWNSLLQNIINKNFPDKDQSITAQTLYTIILTFCVGILIYYLTNYRDSIKNLISSFTSKFK